MCACLCVRACGYHRADVRPVSVGIRVYDEGFSVNIRARACARGPCTCACWWWWWWGRSFEDELYY